MKVNLFRSVSLALALGWLLLAMVLRPTYQVAGSPDEAANRFFISHLAEEGELPYTTGLSAEQNDYFHPRSVYVKPGQILPGSFLGFLFFGAGVEKIVVGAKFFFVPLLALGALYFLYKLFREFWTPWWSLLGVTLIALHPAWIQFQTLPFYHNGAFVSFLIIAGYALKRHHAKPTLSRALFFALAYGAALFIRPSEVLWTGPLVAIVLLTMPLGWRWFLMSVGVVAVMQLPWMIASRSLYGALTATAYTPADNVETIVKSSSSWYGFLLKPAGGHGSWRFLSSALWYLFLLVPAWSALALVSLSRYFRQKFPLPNKALKLSLASLIVLYVLWYYGSWDLYPNSPSWDIGSLASYVRYWLPIYVAMGAGVVLFLKRLWEKSPRLSVVLMSGLLVSQISVSLGHPTAGLLHRYRQAAEANKIQQELLTKTEPQSLIIAGKFDVALWPKRLVGFRLPDQDKGMDVLRQIARERPVYLIGTPRQYREDEVALRLRQFGMDLSDGQKIQENTVWSIRAL